MYLAGYIERMGTGTRDIINLCQESGLMEPEFIQEDFFRVVLWRKKVVAGQDNIYLLRIPSVITGETKRSEIQYVVGIKHRETFFENYLKPAVEKGLVEMTIPVVSSKIKFFIDIWSAIILLVCKLFVVVIIDVCKTLW